MSGAVTREVRVLRDDRRLDQICHNVAEGERASTVLVVADREA